MYHEDHLSPLGQECLGLGGLKKRGDVISIPPLSGKSNDKAFLIMSIVGLRIYF